MDITYVLMHARSYTVQGQSCMKHKDVPAPPHPSIICGPEHNMWTQYVEKKGVLLPDLGGAQYIHLPPAAAPCQIHLPDMQLSGTN